MAAFKKGDHIRVTFDGVIEAAYGNYYDLREKTSGNFVYGIPQSAGELVEPVEPAHQAPTDPVAGALLQIADQLLAANLLAYGTLRGDLVLPAVSRDQLRSLLGVN